MTQVHVLLLKAYHLRREILFLTALVCLFVCQQLYAKSYERISMKFSGSVVYDTKNNPLD